MTKTSTHRGWHMIISYTHRFIFVHVYKVAGTSIRKALEPYAHRPRNMPCNRVVRKLRLDEFLLFHRHRIHPHHIRAREIQNRLPSWIYDAFFKFAFVRNPWDWQVSLYAFMLKNADHPQHQLISALPDFEAYIQWRVENEVRLQKDFVTDGTGNCIVDFVGRFERLEGDFADVGRRLDLPLQLPHLNASHHKAYRHYYSDRSAELVATAFRDDIEYFDYAF